jgi:hypothetical protein
VALGTAGTGCGSGCLWGAGFFASRTPLRATTLLTSLALTATCLSPFNRFAGEQLKLPRFVKQPPYMMLKARVGSAARRQIGASTQLTPLASGRSSSSVCLPSTPQADDNDLCRPFVAVEGYDPAHLGGYPVILLA